MDLFAGSNRSVVARYLAGEVSLDSAASELAELWKELALAEGSAKQRMRSRLPGEAYELSDEDIPKLRALMERVEANMDLINEGARRYLKEPRTSAFDDVVRLLARDVARTLGVEQVPVVWYFADNARQLEIRHSEDKCIEDVQQYFQDTFVDTTWPACTRHPNRPLDYVDGAWCCPRDRAAVARFGELPHRSR